jgi:hypothetical protein
MLEMLKKEYQEMTFKGHQCRELKEAKPAKE